MDLTKEQLEKAKQAKSAEELLLLAKENGIGMTEEMAKEYFSELHKTGDISDEELENVAGGLCASYTDIHCRSCGWTTKWTGYFYEDFPYAGPCPICKAPNLYGGEYHR